MISFFGEQCLKDAVVARVQEHQRLDQIIQGHYWECGADGIYRGCAIGCVLHSADHMAYERQLGLPVFLAYLDEHIFESLPADEAKAWPLRFIEAVPVGVDLELVYPRFMHWLLTDPVGVRRYANAQTLPIMDEIAAIYARRIEGIPFVASAAESAERAAWSAAESARSAARSAAWSAAWSAGSAARSAAWSAAGSAGSAAESAENAARSAERAAESAGSAAESAENAARSAAESAERAAIKRQADYLIMLLADYQSQPVPILTPCEDRHPWLKQPV